MTHKDAICASFGDGTRRESRQPKQEIVRQILLRLVDVTGAPKPDAVAKERGKPPQRSFCPRLCFRMDDLRR
jgi:hypothetical protein